MEERYGRAFFVGGAGLVSAQLWRDFPNYKLLILAHWISEEIEVSMHYYSDETLPWICYNLTDTVFHEHRLNADDTPAIPRKI